MRSRAHFRGHGIHPILIPFPIAFIYGAFVFDAAGMAAGRPGWWITGRHLAIAAVVMAVLAAVPGLIDYLTVVPPKSSAKARATKHLAINLTAVACVIAALMLRPPDHPDL